MNLQAPSPARRRALQLMASTAALAGMGALPAGAALTDAAPAAANRLMRRIPRSGETLPAVGLGTYRSFDVGDGESQRASLREVLRRFVALGGRVIDSSPMYGRSETVIGDLAGEAAAGEHLFYATKVWTRGRAAGIEQMEASFRRLRVTRMDLMQIHNLVDMETHHATLRGWEAQGRVRHLGVTHYHAGAYDELARHIESGEFDFVQFNYSIAEREAEARLLPLARDRGVAVIVNRPFAQAGLFGRVRGQPLPEWCAGFDCTSWAQFFLKYILAHPAVTCVIPATGNPAHLADNMAAGAGALPDEATRRRMVALMATL